MRPAQAGACAELHTEGDLMLAKFKAKKLGQNFLINREIACREAEHAHGKTVLEIGPGHGILTRELCARAKKVIAVEKDSVLFSDLRRNLDFGNLELINADFLKLGRSIDREGIDLLIANIPYGISGKVIEWLSENGKEAVLCLQKEFVRRMLAKEGGREYSMLSVVCALQFSITEIMDVPAGNFNPVPRVDSEIIYIRPRAERPAAKHLEIISALMQHKKRTVRKALIDSRAHFNATKERMAEIAAMIRQCNERVFMLRPAELLRLAEGIAKEF